MSEQNTSGAVVPYARGGSASAGHPFGAESEKTGLQKVMSGSVGRNLGLVLALLALVIVGAITAGENFTTFSNALVILRQASIIGVISIGMTLVIIAGGIDLSVGLRDGPRLDRGHPRRDPGSRRSDPLDLHGRSSPSWSDSGPDSSTGS